MLKYFILIILFFSPISYAGVHEDYLNDKIIVFYECFYCTDLPYINHPAYAVQFKPLLTVERENKVTAILNELIDLRDAKNVALEDKNKECAFNSSRVKLMIIGLAWNPILVDAEGFMQVGTQCSKIPTDKLNEIHKFLWQYKDE